MRNLQQIMVCIKGNQMLLHLMMLNSYVSQVVAIYLCYTQNVNC
jgi:hypothetical protein